MIGAPFFRCEHKRVLVCMSMNKSPHDIVGICREMKTERLADDGGSISKAAPGLFFEDRRRLKGFG